MKDLVEDGFVSLAINTVKNKACFLHYAFVVEKKEKEKRKK